jgi:predicted kinase
MTITFRQFLDESINDKGALKAIFVVGIPGAGKSYTVGKLGGAISPRVVNTDRAAEHLSKKLGVTVSADTWNEVFKDSAHRVSRGALANYLNGVLPLFIDGTSNDASNILHRAGILESLGYDVGMVFIDTPLELAKARVAERAKKINREVSLDFLEKVHAQSAENRAFFKGKFPFYVEVKNGEGELTDEVLLKAFKKVAAFFDAPVQNPVGKRALEAMREKGEKYLVPGRFSKEELDKKVEGWYRT